MKKPFFCNLAARIYNALLAVNFDRSRKSFDQIKKPLKSSARVIYFQQEAHHPAKNIETDIQKHTFSHLAVYKTESYENRNRPK